MTRAEANSLLDYHKAGGIVPDSEVLFALWITGDLFGSEPCDAHDADASPSSLH